MAIVNPSALLTKRPEADSNLDRPLTVNGGSPVMRESITNFREPTSFIPGSADSLQGSEQTINEAATSTPLEVLKDAALDAIGAK